MSVRFLDLARAVEEIRPELDAAIARVLESGRYLLGAELEQFEHEWAAAAGARHAVGVGSGLDALTLGMRALGLSPGDEVLVPTNTYIATWLAVSAVGAVPVGVEPDPDSHLVTARSFAAAIGPRTAAILPVHLYGQSVEIDEIRAVADAHDLALVVDAAQAHGVQHGGRPVGALGDVVAWSFYPSKNLGGLADAGAVTTDDQALADRIRRLRSYGAQERDVHVEMGANSRPDELTCAGLLVRLQRLDDWNSRRRVIACRYLEELQGLRLRLPNARGPGDHVWHLFVVGVEDRGAVRSALSAAGVETSVHYPTPPHLQPVYRHRGLGVGSFPVAERLAAEVLSLPIGPHLHADEQSQVIEALAAAVGRA